MHKLLAIAALVAALTGQALAQEAPGPDANTPKTIILPEGQRGGPVAVMAGAHLEVTLDDEMRIASLSGGQLPEADFDASDLSSTEETLVSMGKVGMWASPGAIGYSLMLTTNQTNLKVSNNTSVPIAYVLALYRGDVLDRNYELTTTCTVGAGMATVESWPFLVDGVVIFRILSPPPSDHIMCLDPRKNMNDPEWYPLELQ